MMMNISLKNNPSQYYHKHHNNNNNNNNNNMITFVIIFTTSLLLIFLHLPHHITAQGTGGGGFGGAAGAAFLRNSDSRLGERSYINRMINPDYRQVVPSLDKDAYKHRSYLDAGSNNWKLSGRFRQPTESASDVSDAPRVSARYVMPTATARHSLYGRSTGEVRYNGRNFIPVYDRGGGARGVDEYSHESTDDFKRSIGYVNPAQDLHRTRREKEEVPYYRRF